MALNDYTKDSRCKYAYLFSEGSGGTVEDTSGNGNTGTFRAPTGPNWQLSVPSYNILGQGSRSVLYNNTTDFINAGTSDVVTENGAITVCCWLNQTGAGTNGRILDRTSVLFYADQGVGGKDFIFEVDGTGSNMQLPTQGNVIVFNTWQHICLTWDGSTTATNAHIYVNNVEASYNTTTNGTVPTDNSGQTLWVGNRTDGIRCYNGAIADVGIFNAVLSAAERTDIYQYGLRPILRNRKELCNIGTRIGSRKTVD